MESCIPYVATLRFASRQRRIRNLLSIEVQHPTPLEAQVHHASVGL